MDLNFLDNINLERRFGKRLLFVVDTSDRMREIFLDATNDAIKNVISEICEIQKRLPDLEIGIVVLEFYGEKAKLYPHPPENVNTYSWRNLVHEPNTTYADIGIAFKKLIDKNVFNSFCGEYPYNTVIMVLNSRICDSYKDNHKDSYKDKLATLNTLPLFRTAFKAAIAFGKEIEEEKLIEITNNEKNIAIVCGCRELRKHIREMTIKGALHGLLNEQYIQKLLDDEVYNNNNG